MSWGKGDRWLGPAALLPGSRCQITLRPWNLNDIPLTSLNHTVEGAAQLPNRDQPPEDRQVTSLPNTQGARRERNIRHVLFEILETIFLTAIIFFVIEAFIVQPFEVRQESMEATLEPGQLVLVDK